jgi:branched-chain amino acid transport system permease protein
MDSLIISLLNTVTFGFIIFLLAIGLSLVLGTMGIVNLAHGVLFMMAAYVGLAVMERGGNFLLGALLGVLSAGVLAFILERGFLRYLYKMYNAQVLLTFGFVYIVTNICLWIWGAWPKLGTPPTLLSSFISIGDFHFTTYRFALIFAGLVIAVGLWWLQEKTRVGAIIRAGMDDKEMVMGIGINYERICTGVFCLGACMAGGAGVLAIPVLGASLESGVDFLLLSLCVVIVGGMGSVQGALAGSMLIAFTNTLCIFYFPSLAAFSMYLMVVIMLLLRPYGLLGRKEIQK